MTMTGRDLIVYILENGLEDEPVFKDGKIIGFMTAREAAVKLDTGVETIKAMYALGMLEGFELNESIYILANASKPKVDTNGKELEEQFKKYLNSVYGKSSGDDDSSLRLFESNFGRVCRDYPYPGELTID